MASYRNRETAATSARLRRPRNEGIPPPPPATIRSIWARVSFSLVSKSGPNVPCAPAAASVWQPAHPALRKTFRPSGGGGASPPPQPATARIAPAATKLVRRGFRLRLRAPAPAAATTTARLGLLLVLGAGIGAGRARGRCRSSLVGRLLLLGTQVGEHARRGCAADGL